jgi:hypothetical protein
MRNLNFGQPTRRKDGHVGARANVSIRGEGGADGHYSIDTHALTSTEVAAEVDRLHAFHDTRAARMDGLRAIQATPIEMGDATYRVVDATVRYPQDAAYCTLYLDVRQIVNGAKVKVAGFPLRLLYKTATEIPDDTTIVALITDAIPHETEDLNALHEEFIGKVSARLGAKLVANR